METLVAVRNLEEEKRKQDEFYQEHGYPPNIEDDIIYMLRKGNVTEEGMKELWAWYCKEMDRPLEEEEVY